MPIELGWLGADLKVSAELAEEHRKNKFKSQEPRVKNQGATQCFGGADLSAQKLQMWHRSED